MSVKTHPGPGKQGQLGKALWRGVPDRGPVRLCPIACKGSSTTPTRCLDEELYRGHTFSMKTAVSLPDALYKDAEITARKLGIPRSQLFARALEEFIRHHQREGITEKLDAIYSAMESGKEPSQSPASLEAMREFTKNDSW